MELGGGIREDPPPPAALGPAGARAGEQWGCRAQNSVCVWGGAGRCGHAPAPTCLSVPFAEWPEAVAPAPWEAVCRECRQCVGGVQVCRVCGVRACWGAGCAGMRDCRVRGCAGVRCAEVQGVRVQGCGAQRYRGAGAGVPRMGVGWRRQVLAEAAAASPDAGPTGAPPWLCPDSEARVQAFQAVFTEP